MFQTAQPDIAPVLEAVFRGSPDPIAISTCGRVHAVNRAYLECFGFEDERELLGLPVLEQIAPASRDAIAEILRRRADGEDVPRSYRLTGQRRDGSEIPLEVRTLTCEIDGQIYTVGFFRNLRDRPREGPQVRESEDFYRAIFEVNSAVKLLISPVTGRILDANRAAAEYYGWPLDELRQKRITDINTLTRAEVEAEMENARSRRRGYFRFRHRTARGIRHVEVHSSPVEIAGEQLLLSIIHDVTERDELEEQLSRAQRLESVGRLAGGIAHDFNNLLTVMMASAGTLERRLPGDSPLRGPVEDLTHAADRAAELIRDLLAFGKRQPMQPVSLDLGERVKQVAGLLGQTMPANIAVQSECAPGLPPVYVDPGQIEQAVVNLALNARDAMPDGGTIALRTELRHVRDRGGVVPAGTWVCLSVADTGRGMDEATRARAFEPFFTTKQASQGTGLGLARVYGIVSQSGGHTTLVSEPERGTEVSIYLPPSEVAPARPEPTSRARRPSREHTVLLVEDDAGVRGVLADALVEAGFRVLEASSAEEALALPRDTRAALDGVVSDVVMPGTSGVELADELLAEHPGLRVVLLSGHLADGDRARIPEGAVFMTKPLKAEALIAILADQPAE